MLFGHPLCCYLEMKKCKERRYAPVRLFRLILITDFFFLMCDQFYTVKYRPDFVNFFQRSRFEQKKAGSA